MNQMERKPMTSRTSLLPVLAALVAVVVVVTAHAAAPGITGTANNPVFNLVAQPAYITQPDGQMVYSWGYGCASTPGFAPAAISGAKCPQMQVPGPTLIVTEGDTVTVNLTNNLPSSAGNTSILFPGFNVSPTGGATGLLTQEAAPGSHRDLHIYCGNAGHARLLQRNARRPASGDGLVRCHYRASRACAPRLHCGFTVTNPGGNAAAKVHWGESDFRLAAAAYDNPATCYDREYLFQFSEMDPSIHLQAEAQAAASKGVRRRCRMQPGCCDGTVPPGVLHDQWTLHAR